MQNAGIILSLSTYTKFKQYMSFMATNAPYPNTQYCWTTTKSAKSPVSRLSLNADFDVPLERLTWRLQGACLKRPLNVRAPSVVTTFTHTIAWDSVRFLDLSIILSVILTNRDSKCTGPQLACRAI